VSASSGSGRIPVSKIFSVREELRTAALSISAYEFPTANREPFRAFLLALGDDLIVKIEVPF
jgi:hypothetical protein